MYTMTMSPEAMPQSAPTPQEQAPILPPPPLPPTIDSLSSAQNAKVDTLLQSMPEPALVETAPNEYLRETANELPENPLTAEQNAVFEGVMTRSEAMPAVEPPPVLQNTLQESAILQGPPPVIVEAPPVIPDAPRAVVEAPPVLTPEVTPASPSTEVPVVEARIDQIDSRVAALEQSLRGYSGAISEPTQKRVSALAAAWNRFTDYSRSPILNGIKGMAGRVESSAGLLREGVERMQANVQSAEEVRQQLKVRYRGGKLEMFAGDENSEDMATPEKPATTIDRYLDEATRAQLDSIEVLSSELSLTAEERHAMISEYLGEDLATFHEQVAMLDDGVELVTKLATSGASEKLIHKIVARKAAEVELIASAATEQPVIELEEQSESEQQKQIEQAETEASEVVDSRFEQLRPTEMEFATTFTPDLAFTSAAHEYARLSVIEDPNELMIPHTDYLYAQNGKSSDLLESTHTYDTGEGTPDMKFLRETRKNAAQQTKLMLTFSQLVAQDRNTALKAFEQSLSEEYGADNVTMIRTAEPGNQNPDAYMDGMFMSMKITAEGKIELRFEDPNQTVTSLTPKSESITKLVEKEDA
jgi:hypothetical protein